MNFGPNAQNLITPKELAKLLNISKPSVYRLIDSRALTFHQVGGSIRFLASDISDYLSRVRVEPIDKQYERIQKKQ